MNSRVSPHPRHRQPRRSPVRHAPPRPPAFDDPDEVELILGPGNERPGGEGS